MALLPAMKSSSVALYQAHKVSLRKLQRVITSYDDK